jgi:hypothetical protein
MEPEVGVQGGKRHLAHVMVVVAWNALKMSNISEILTEV